MPASPPFLLCLTSSLALCLATSCGERDDDAPPESPGPGPETEPGGPTILSVSADKPSITDLHTDSLDTFTITAIVTDPDGIEDLVGGQLVDSTTERALGAFVAPSQEGAYQITITWDELDTQTPIDFTTAAEGNRELRLEFFDQAGHKATQLLSIGFDCSRNRDLACSGTCGLFRYDNVCSYPATCPPDVPDLGSVRAGYYREITGLTLYQTGGIYPSVYSNIVSLGMVTFTTDVYLEVLINGDESSWLLTTDECQDGLMPIQSVEGYFYAGQTVHLLATVGAASDVANATVRLTAHQP